MNRGARLDDQSQTSTVVIGGAVHFTKGLLSHACDENTNHQNALNTMSVVRAQCTIQPGQEVTVQDLITVACTSFTSMSVVFNYMVLL